VHGEYKTPAGKLVVVDFGVEDDRLSNVVVSGDFFLEPPEALADIVRALEGARAELGEEELAGRIRGTLGEGVEMVGFSPEAIARASVWGLG
jgi:lipoate-protein ligase A